MDAIHVKCIFYLPVRFHHLYADIYIRVNQHDVILFHYENVPEELNNQRWSLDTVKARTLPL